MGQCHYASLRWKITCFLFWNGALRPTQNLELNKNVCDHLWNSDLAVKLLENNMKKSELTGTFQFLYNSGMKTEICRDRQEVSNLEYSAAWISHISSLLYYYHYLDSYTSNNSVIQRFKKKCFAWFYVSGFLLAFIIFPTEN